MFNPIRLDAHNPSPMTGDGNHTYLLIEENASAVLIDAGIGERRHLEELGRDARRPSRLASRCIGHAWTSRSCLRSDGDRSRPSPRAVLQVPVAGRRPRLSRSNGCLSVRATDSRLPARTLVALHTPGHSPDHLAFWHEESRTIFTGDLVVQGSSVMIHATRGGDLGNTFIRSNVS